MNERSIGHADAGEAPTIPMRIVMLLGGLMVAIAMAAIAPVLPEIERALAVTDQEKLLVKMMVPFAGAAMVVGAPLTGFLIDRIGLRSLLIMHGILFAVAGTAGFYLQDLYALVGSRFFVGFAAAGMGTISMTMINTRLEGIARAKWMGFHIATAMLGSLVIFPLIGVLGEIGWRFPFLIYAVGLAVACLAMFGLPGGRPALAETPEAIREPSGNPLKWFPLWFLPLALTVGTITYLPTVYLGFVAREVGLSSPSTLSMIMLADSLIGASMSLIFGWSRKRVSSYGAFVFSFACTGTGMLVVSLSSGIGGIIAGMLIFGFGIGWFMPNVMTSLAQRVAQTRQGSAVGILKATHHMASPLGVLAVEPISRLYGPHGAMAAGSILSFCAVAVFASLALRSPRPAQATPSAA